jgi:hypothetical protein
MQSNFASTITFNQKKAWVPLFFQFERCRSPMPTTPSELGNCIGGTCTCHVGLLWSIKLRNVVDYSTNLWCGIDLVQISRRAITWMRLALPDMILTNQVKLHLEQGFLRDKPHKFCYRTIFIWNLNSKTGLEDVDGSVSPGPCSQPKFKKAWISLPEKSIYQRGRLDRLLVQVTKTLICSTITSIQKAWMALH